MFDARRVDDWTWEIPVTARAGMRVPARIFADDTLFRKIRSDRSLEQLVNVATLPGVESPVLGMPDAHEGYGFPVGGVAALRVSDGVISPGGVGYDINCGVRLLASDLTRTELGERIEPLMHEMSRALPSGTGRGGVLVLDSTELRQVLAQGSPYLAERGMATADDLEVTEAGGCLPGADPDAVSDRARQRGHTQVGTIGSGNHFVEVQVVDAILDQPAARSFGLFEGQVVVLVHTGSRGLGHQVCTDYVRLMDTAMPKYGIRLPDRQLACAPFASPEGRAYFGAMCAAANFAWANRQALTHLIRGVFHRVIGPEVSLQLVYDVAHNIAKVETYGGMELCVHRKGATRAFGPANPETPERYRDAGQPVFIPGSMGTASWILAGNDLARERSFGSTCHGAGRAMSRSAAKRATSGREVRDALAARGIVVRCGSNAELAEEAPIAYKDVERVTEVVERAGLARRVARLRPLGVLKG
jgi:tRNA-splicing ligase RtcB